MVSDIQWTSSKPIKNNRLYLGRQSEGNRSQQRISLDLAQKDVPRLVLPKPTRLLPIRYGPSTQEKPLDGKTEELAKGDNKTKLKQNTWLSFD